MFLSDELIKEKVEENRELGKEEKIANGKLIIRRYRYEYRPLYVIRLSIFEEQ